MVTFTGATRGHVLLIPQGIPIVVTAVANRKDATGQVLAQMFRNRFLTVRVGGVQLFLANGRFCRTGHHQMNMTVDQGRKYRAIRQVNNDHSPGVGIFGIRDPLDPPFMDGNHPMFNSRISGPIDEPADPVTDSRWSHGKYWCKPAGDAF
jgi:hypothetical protein